ncbi:hypothetical protein AB0R12_40460, partial [Streptomyces niveus]
MNSAGESRDGGAGSDYFTGDAAARGLGIVLVDTGPGRATLRMSVRGDMVNGHGTAHGGYLFLLVPAPTAAVTPRSPLRVRNPGRRPVPFIPSVL